MPKIAICGGGPAGLFAGLLLSEKNLVTIFEKESYPIQKVCGEGIMPNGLELLKKNKIINLEDDQLGHKFEGISYFNKEGEEIKGRFKNSFGKGIKREDLLNLLISKSKLSKNIKLNERHQIIKINDIEKKILEIKNKDTSEIYSEQFDFVIAADGINSIIRKDLGVKVKNLNSHQRLAVRAYFNIPPWNKHVEVHWGNGYEAYVTPIGDNEVNVLFTWDKDQGILKNNHNPFNDLLQLFPILSNRLKDKTPTQMKSTGGFAKESAKIFYKDYFFIGDALIFYDGITGEGLSLAFEEANILSTYLLSNQSKIWYLIKTNLLLLKLKTMTTSALFFTKHAWWQKIFFKFLYKNPKIFDFLLTLNTL